MPPPPTLIDPSRESTPLVQKLLDGIEGAGNIASLPLVYFAQIPFIILLSQAGADAAAEAVRRCDLPSEGRTTGAKASNTSGVGW